MKKTLPSGLCFLMVSGLFFIKMEWGHTF